MPEAGETRLRAFWSGTLTFGLVSIPVDLFAANRPRGGGLRMVSAEGTPLERRYVCPADEEPVSYDEIIRGYEVEKGRFVTVTSDELEALAPEQSRDIDLRRFVPEGDIPPMYFQRAYFLMPSGRSARAYYLLTQVMEKTGRAGVATFVMRGKAYVVAILADNGVLRAETLRFPDELRTPADVGLEDRPRAEKKKVSALRKAIDEHTEKEFDPEELEDRWVRRLEALVADKLERGEDVHETPEAAEAAAPDGEGAEVVDLMSILEQRLGAKGATTGSKRSSTKKTKSRSDAAAKSKGDGSALTRKTKAELYEQAQELDIPGRSSMTKDELIEAIRDAS